MVTQAKKIDIETEKVQRSTRQKRKQKKSDDNRVRIKEKTDGLFYNCQEHEKGKLGGARRQGSGAVGKQGEDKQPDRRRDDVHLIHCKL